MRRRERERNGRVCFFKKLPSDQGRIQVRFGVTRRPEAQIITCVDSWLRIRELLDAEGYSFIEEPPDEVENPRNSPNRAENHKHVNVRADPSGEAVAQRRI